MEILVVGTAIACAAMGGVFFAFSSFVMQGLVRLPSAQGMVAMQSINVTAVTPIFMTALFGTAAACLTVAIGAAREWSSSAGFYAIAGSLCYLLGIIAVTMAFNVPLNNALMAADASTTDGQRVWTNYARTWTAWNHVRAIAGFVAAALLLISSNLGS